MKKSTRNKISGAITILVNRDRVTVEIHDRNASINIVSIELTAEEFCACLGRQAMVHCDLDVADVTLIGKKHECKTFTFEIGDSSSFYSKRPSNEELHEKCLNALAAQEMSEWEPDKYYGAQNSFTVKDGKYYANVTIRRWV